MRARMRKCAVKMRKAQIVADGKTQFAPRQFGNNRLVTRLIGLALAVGFAARKVPSGAIKKLRFAALSSESRMASEPI